MAIDFDLKAWRTDRGMTQQQAADALGIGNSTVRAIEAGTREMTGTLVLACHGFDALATENAPDDDSGLSVEMPRYEPVPTIADLADLRRRIVSLERLERPVSILQQRMTELSAAIEDAGLPLRQAPIPMTDDEAEEAELRLLKAQRLAEMQRAATAAPGALTDDEREEAEKARALASLPPEDEIQRQIRQGMLEQREREKLERAKKQQAEEMAMISRRAARSVLPD